MRNVLRAFFSRRITLAIGIYALLAKLLIAHDISTATLTALFLALVAQLGHRALDYYGSVKDAVRGVVGVHADRLASVDRTMADQATKLETAEKNIARLSSAVERKPVF
jgi:hypothetical protein